MRVLLVFIMSIVWGSESFGFSCFLEKVPFDERAQKAVAIFTGTPIADVAMDKPSEYFGRIVKVRVTKVFKGDIKKESSVDVYYKPTRTRYDDCDPSLQDSYVSAVSGQLEQLFYVMKNENLFFTYKGIGCGSVGVKVCKKEIKDLRTKFLKK